MSTINQANKQIKIIYYIYSKLTQVKWTIENENTIILVC